MSTPSLLRSPVLVRRSLFLLAAGFAVFLAVTSSWRPGIATWWTEDKVKLAVLVQGCFWWGAAACTALLVVLASTTRFWARSWPAAFPVESASPPRWFWFTVAALMIAGTACRAPRLGLSLYNDEAHVFRSHIAGRIAMADLGKPEKFRQAPWLSTLYENRAGNNSMPFSIAARTSYDTWRGFSGQPPGTVNEPALRLPVLVCGVLSIAAIAFLGFRLGGPWMGVAAGLFATFHPWHLRYSAEARGYGILFLVLPLLFLALHRALQTGRWRSWLTFGLMEYLAVAVWFGSAHLLVGLNFTLAAMACLPVLKDRRLSAVRTNLLVPVIVSGCLALGLYLQFNLPLYVELSKSLADPGFFKSDHPFPLAWFQDTAGFLAFGTPGLALNPDNLSQPTVTGWLADPFWRYPAVLGIAVCFGGTGFGLVRLFRQDGTARAVTGAFTGGALLTFLYCSAKGIVFLKWYTLFLLPGLLLFLAAGLAPRRFTARSAWRAVLLLPLLGCWVAAAVPVLTQSRENLRGAVEMARETTYPAALENPHHTLYGVLWSESPVYAPDATTLRAASDLEALVSRARAEHLPLFVSHGHADQAQQHNPDVFAILHDPAQFRLLTTLPGLDDSDSTHFLYQFLN